MKFCHLYPLSQKMEGSIDVFFLLYPSGLTGLEPAASALTGRCSDQLNYNPREIKKSVQHRYSYDFIQAIFYLDFRFESPCCNKQRCEWYIDIHTGMHFSESDADY